ncbi:MAG: peptide chain release factor N(5)-glutamine methyltransferase [Clostridia bacterium]|nr:peptide chain release factor N(5)-glutamine methyltransferase [Clostridia bacterium]
MVTRSEWLKVAAARLESAGCEDASFDARCLLENFGGLPRGHRPDGTPLTEQQVTALGDALEQRASGRPLQYILGEWDFLALTLRVGEGVLIPRPDTEALCETAAGLLAEVSAPKVLDLCAGTGCVGLGVASLCPGAQVTAVELSEQAFPYLQENIARYPALSVTAVRGDVLADWEHFSDGWDAILSNPPYIPTADLSGLMREVQHEPMMALDGAADGLAFYRVIAARWSGLLRNGGFCAVEVGFDQAPAVVALFADAGLKNIRIIPDLAGISRVVVGEK